MTTTLNHRARRAAPTPVRQRAASFACTSCRRDRALVDMRGDVCVECADDANDAEALAGWLPVNVPRRSVRAHLERLADVLTRQPPFTAAGFAVISRKVLAWLQAVHRRLDVAFLDRELAYERHVEDNAGALAAFIRAELELPTLT